MSSKHNAQVGALAGVKVVGFDWVVVGPLATSYLGDQGATVIKVESHLRPDSGRLLAPYKDNIPGLDRGSYFCHQNTSKYSITVNLKNAAGRGLILKLLKWADVLVENMAPGVMDNLGLSYSDVKQVNPEIIYVSLSIQGRFGPHHKSTGFGQLAAALSGCTHLTGWPDRGPSPCHGAYVDYLAARLTPSLIIGALDYRRRTGKGQYIDNSILENTAFFFSLPVMDYVTNGRIWQRMGNRHPHACPHGVFKCAGDDRWLAVSVFSDKEWRSFCKVLGRPEWLDDEKYTNFQTRKKNEDELEKLIEAHTVHYDVEYLETELQLADIPAGAVESTKDLFSDPQIKYRRAYRQLKHKEIGLVWRASPASNYSRTSNVQTAAPLLGEHNEYVFGEILNLSEKEIRNLYSQGAITTEKDLPV